MLHFLSVKCINNLPRVNVLCLTATCSLFVLVEKHLIYVAVFFYEPRYVPEEKGSDITAHAARHLISLLHGRSKSCLQMEC